MSDLTLIDLKWSFWHFTKKISKPADSKPTDCKWICHVEYKQVLISSFYVFCSFYYFYIFLNNCFHISSFFWYKNLFRSTKSTFKRLYSDKFFSHLHFSLQVWTCRESEFKMHWINLKDFIKCLNSCRQR